MTDKEALSAGVLSEVDRRSINNAFDHNPQASGDWVITRKEWRQLFTAVESIVAAHVKAAKAEAWDEGHDHQDGLGICECSNPYRTGDPR